MEVKIVLGHAFGDEGKGVTVQWLCKKAIEEGKKPVVIRFSGGPQAAHTIVNNGTEHICSSFGSGVLLGVPTILFPNVYVDPICLMNEYRVLKDKGIDPIISFNENSVITPYDVIAGQRNKKVRSDGTCGKGLFATFDRCNKVSAHKNGLDFIHTPDYYLTLASICHGINRDDKYDEMFREAYMNIQELFDMPIISINYDVVIFEGSQGLLLDMDRGFFPHVTPSKVGLNGIPEIFLRNAEVYLVTRTYTTRHGNGYIPVEPHNLDLSCKHETNVDNEFQGEFKTGALDIPLLNKAFDRHCIDNYKNKYGIKLNLVITHMDVIKEDFRYIDSDYVYRKAKVTSAEDVAGRINLELSYTPQDIYYNDSVESNIKQIE